MFLLGDEKLLIGPVPEVNISLSSAVVEELIWPLVKAVNLTDFRIYYSKRV